MLFFLALHLVVFSQSHRILRAPVLKRKLPISNASMSSLTLSDRGLLSQQLPISSQEILNECNVISADSYDKHFPGAVGALFPASQDNIALTLKYQQKLSYYFPKWYSILFAL